MLVKKLRDSRWARGISRALVALFVWPLAMLSLSGRPAQAQAKMKTIAIMDFENATDQKGMALGRNAADAVFLALPNDRYEVVDRESVEKKMESLGMRPPLDLHALGRIGKEMNTALGLEEIFVGKVLKADVRKNAPKQASVRIEVRVFDIVSHEFTNGAVVDGVSSPRYEDVNSDVLLDEAVNKAATGAVYKITTQTIPEGTVLLNKLGEVLVNIGQQHGVKPGMEFIVVRGVKGQEEKVGRIQVTSVTSRDSTARIKEEVKGITSEDHCRAVYTTAPTSGGMLGALGGASKSKSGFLNFRTFAYVAIGLGLLLLTYKMVKTNKTQINYSVDGTTARAALTGNYQPAIKVTWKKPGTAAVDLLGYQIYRSNTQFGNYEPVGEVDGPTETVFFDTTGMRTVEITQDGDTDSGGGTAETEEVDVIGVSPGVTYYYRIRRIFVEAVQEGDGGDVQFRVTRSDLSPPTPGATPLERPLPQSPVDSAAVDPAAVAFRWISVAGGDQYRLQVSDSPGFPPTRTYNSPDGDARMVLPGGAGTQTMSATLNISALFPAKDPVTGQSFERDLFWRVGARHQTDGASPDDGFIFSDAKRMKTQELPPDPG